MLIILAAAFLFELVIVAPLLLWLGAKICRVGGVNFRRALAAHLLAFAVQVLLAGVKLLLDGAIGPRMLVDIVLVVVLLGLSVALMRFVLRTTVWRAAGAYAITVACLVGLALGVRATVLEAFFIRTGGMAPTILPGDRILANKAAYSFGRPACGEVVVFRPPQRPEILYVQRVAAVGGDRVWIRGGKAHVNEPMGRDGERADTKTREGPAGDPTLTPPVWQFLARGHPLPDEVMNQGPILVPEGSVYLLGDNVGSSLDSRFFGPVKVSQVIGRAEVIYWSRKPPPRPWDGRPAGRSPTPPGRIRWERLGEIR